MENISAASHLCVIFQAREHREAGVLLDRSLSESLNQALGHSLVGRDCIWACISPHMDVDFPLFNQLNYPLTSTSPRLLPK